MTVDGENPPRTHQLCRSDGELPDRPAAKHRNRVARFDFGIVGAKPAGRENVRNQNRLVVTDFIGQFHHADIGERDARLFRLQSVERPGVFRTAEEGGSGVPAIGIGAIALGVIDLTAIAAVAAGNCRHHHDAVAAFKIAQHWPDFLHHAHRFMAENGSGLHALESSAHHMKVGAADRRRTDADHGVRGIFDLRFPDILKTDVADPVEHHRFHDCLREHGSFLKAVPRQPFRMAQSFKRGNVPCCSAAYAFSLPTLAHVSRVLRARLHGRGSRPDRL